MRKIGIGLTLLTVLCFLPAYAQSPQSVSIMTNLPLDIKADKTIYVVIKADPTISSQQIHVIKNAIMSKSTITENGKKFYEGWQGALTEASSMELHKSLFTMPINLKIVNSSASEDNNHITVTIILTSSKSDLGYDGYTSYTTNHNRVDHVQIIIYQADILSNEDLSAITRHEFGHALGLGHSSSPGDLMYPNVDTKTSLIPLNDIKALDALYDGLALSAFTETIST